MFLFLGEFYKNFKICHICDKFINLNNFLSNKNEYIYFKCHIVGTRCQQFPLWVPFDCINLVLVPLECFYRHHAAQFTNVNLLVRTARREAVVALPVDVESWRCVKRKLLLTCTGLCIPNYSRLFH